MVAAEETALTERQIAVLRFRADGHTDGEIADRLDAAARTEATETAEATAADVRDIERTAERTIRRARRTLDLAATLRRVPTEIAAVAGTTIDELAAEIYARGDDAGIKVNYCHADLHARLRDVLDGRIENDRLRSAATLTLGEDGRVRADGQAESDDFGDDGPDGNGPTDAADRSRDQAAERERPAGSGRG